MPDGNLKILVVDNDEVDQRDIERSLRHRNIANEIVAVSDGKDALEVLRGVKGEEPLEWPYIIITELNMPGMNGFGLLRELREDEQLKPTPVFVLTSSKNREDMVRAYQYNIAAYLVKAELGVSLIDTLAVIDDFLVYASLP